MHEGLHWCCVISARRRAREDSPAAATSGDISSSEMHITAAGGIELPEETATAINMMMPTGESVSSTTTPTTTTIAAAVAATPQQITGEADAATASLVDRALPTHTLIAATTRATTEKSLLEAAVQSAGGRATAATAEASHTSLFFSPVEADITATSRITAIRASTPTMWRREIARCPATILKRKVISMQHFEIAAQTTAELRISPSGRKQEEVIFSTCQQQQQQITQPQTYTRVFYHLLHLLFRFLHLHLLLFLRIVRFFLFNMKTSLRLSLLYQKKKKKRRRNSLSLCSSMDFYNNNNNNTTSSHPSSSFFFFLSLLMFLLIQQLFIYTNIQYTSSPPQERKMIYKTYTNPSLFLLLPAAALPLRPTRHHGYLSNNNTNDIPLSSSSFSSSSSLLSPSVVSSPLLYSAHTSHSPSSTQHSSRSDGSENLVDEDENQRNQRSRGNENNINNITSRNQRKKEEEGGSNSNCHRHTRRKRKNSSSTALLLHHIGDLSGVQTPQEHQYTPPVVITSSLNHDISSASSGRSINEKKLSNRAASLSLNSSIPHTTPILRIKEQKKENKKKEEKEKNNNNNNNNVNTNTTPAGRTRTHHHTLASISYSSLLPSSHTPSILSKTPATAISPPADIDKNTVGTIFANTTAASNSTPVVAGARAAGARAGAAGNNSLPVAAAAATSFPPSPLSPPSPSPSHPSPAAAAAAGISPLAFAFNSRAQTVDTTAAFSRIRGSAASPVAIPDISTSSSSSHRNKEKNSKVNSSRNRGSGGESKSKIMLEMSTLMKPSLTQQQKNTDINRRDVSYTSHPPLLSSSTGIIYTHEHPGISITARAASPSSQEMKNNTHTSLKGDVRQVTMPALSSTMKEGRIVSWAKQIGDPVQVGDLLMVVESDKADMDVEAFDAGYMAYHATPEGSSAAVGSTVALIAEREEDLLLIEEHGMGILSEDAGGSREEETAAGATATAEEATAATTIRLKETATGIVGDGRASRETTAEEVIGDEMLSRISQLLLPALSPSSRDGHIAVWKKKEGDTVKQGEVLFVVESDKADMDVEAPHDGILARILVGPGVKIPVNTTVALYARDTASAAAAARLSLKQQQQQQPHFPGIHSMPEGTREVFLYIDGPAAGGASARVIKWLRHVGDTIKVGDTLAIVEDVNSGHKSEIRSGDEGYLAAINVDEQQEAAVGETLGFLVESHAAIQLVQQMRLQEQKYHSVFPERGREGGKEEERREERKIYTSFPNKKEASDALATWTSPSVDQDVNAQLPPGLTAQDLQAEFLRRLQQRLPPAVVEKMKSKEGEEYIKRLSLRVPPPHTLRDTTPATTIPPPPPLPPTAATITTTTAGGGGTAATALLSSHNTDEARQSLSPSAAQTKTISGIEQAERTTLGSQRRDSYSSSSSSSSSLPYDPAGKRLATDQASSLAAKHKLDLLQVTGTGTHGRVILADVQRHLHLPMDETDISIRSSNSNSSSVNSSNSGKVHEKDRSQVIGLNIRELPTGIQKMNSMQKAVAKNMDATVGVPVFKVSRGIYVDKLEAMLSELKQIIAESNKQAAAAGQQQQPPITMTALLAKAVALTLTRHPLLNAGYDENSGGQIKHPGSADLAIAVSLEDGGLVTPVLRNAEKKNIFTLAKEWNLLTEKAKQKRLTPADLTGGSFYISNMGMFGVQQFDAVLPRGVGTIMAVGATETLPQQQQQQHGKSSTSVAKTTSGAEFSRRMTVTLTCDHRHIYGTHAALFLKGTY